MLVDGITYYVKDNVENLPYKQVSSNYPVENDDRLLVDTSGGTVTITLPASPYGGQVVQFASTGSWESTNWTVNRNGNTIMGLSENMTVDTDVGFGLVFFSDNNDWRVI